MLGSGCGPPTGVRSESHDKAPCWAGEEYDPSLQCAPAHGAPPPHGAHSSVGFMFKTFYVATPHVRCHELTVL
jgi:hypothetical protein